MKIYIRMPCCECVRMHRCIYLAHAHIMHFAICDVRMGVILGWGQPWRLQAPNVTRLVAIRACKCPSRGKQAFSHDEKSRKRSWRLAKVHSRLFTQPRSALYPVASYRRVSYQSAVVSAVQPCGHTVIQRCVSSGLVARCKSQSNYLHVSGTPVTL